MGVIVTKWNKCQVGQKRGGQTGCVPCRRNGRFTVRGCRSTEILGRRKEGGQDEKKHLVCSYATKALPTLTIPSLPTKVQLQFKDAKTQQQLAL